VSSRPHYLAPLLRKHANGLGLGIQGREALLAPVVEGAFESATRNRGLLGRDSLAADTALIIAPCNSIHTFFMRFSIDVIYTARSGEVLKIAAGVRPWRISLCPRAFAVVEMAAGSANRHALKVGDHLEIAGRRSADQ